jgi:signal transduction histidine kinase
LGQKDELVVKIEEDVEFDRLEHMLESAIFRIVQESLTNVKRHSGAGRARVTLKESHGLIQIEIVDRGTGFDPKLVPNDRFGLRGIRERAWMFGGNVKVESAPGQGTRIKVELPVHLPDSNEGNKAP